MGTTKVYDDSGRLYLTYENEEEVSDSRWYSLGLVVGTGLLLGQIVWNPVLGISSWLAFLTIVFWVHK